MNQIIESYVDVWVNWKNFSGRTRRSAFWYAILANLIVTFVLGLIAGLLSLEIIGDIYSLVFLVPSIALCVRRLHDVGHSGWWYLIAFTIIGGIVLLVWFCQDSKPDNQYGPSPKGYSAGPAAGYPGYPQAPQAPQNNYNNYNGPELK